MVVAVVGHFERDNLLIACIPWDRKVFSQLCEFSGEEEEQVRAKVQTLTDSVQLSQATAIVFHLNIFKAILTLPDSYPANGKIIIQL